MKEQPDNHRPTYETNHVYDPVRYSRHERRVMASQQRKYNKMMQKTAARTAKLKKKEPEEL